MKHLEAWRHTCRDGFYGMIRNKNTSYAFGFFSRKQVDVCDGLIRRINASTREQCLVSYRNAKEKNLLCIKHEYSFKDARRIYIRPLSGEELARQNRKLDAKEEKKWNRGYAICALIPGRKGEVVVAKKNLRKDLEAIMKTWRQEYTTEELLGKIADYLLERRREQLKNQKQTKSN